MEHTVTSAAGYLMGVFTAPAPVQLLYDARDPGDGQIDSSSQMGLFPIMLTRFGLLFLGGGLWGLCRRLARPG